jgi:hypothetical protein
MFPVMMISKRVTQYPFSRNHALWRDSLAGQGRWEDAMDDDDEKGNLENPWNLSDLI